MFIYIIALRTYMTKSNPQDIVPDFYKFKKIPPAFAGALTDWSLGSREITATIVDLIAKDTLAVIGDKVILNKNTSNLMHFEKAVLNTIFENRKDLTVEEFSNIAYKDKFKKLIKIISDGLIQEGFLKEDYYKKFDEFCDSVILDDRQKDNYFAKYKNFFQLKRRPIVNALIFTFFFALFLIIIPELVMLLIGKLTPPNVVATIIVLGAVFIISLYIHTALHLQFKKRYYNFDKLMLTEKGLAFKRDSVDLMNYMKKYPMYEDRISNELVGYAIAFGFGKKWMKKLGKHNAIMNIFLEKVSPKHDVMLNLMNMS